MFIFFLVKNKRSKYSEAHSTNNTKNGEELLQNEICNINFQTVEIDEGEYYIIQDNNPNIDNIQDNNIIDNIQNNNVNDIVHIQEMDKYYEAEEVIINEDFNENEYYKVEKAKNEEDYKVRDIDDIRKWSIKCNLRQNNLEELLNILRRNSYPNLPKCAKTFLSTNEASYNIQVMNGLDGTAGEFVYFGIEKWLYRNFLTDLHSSSDISLQFNIDGMSLFNSSLKQFWPILCKIICETNIYSPFCVAIYSGNSKPANNHDFFKEFIEEINILMSKELVINQKKFNVKIHSFICDIPARKFLKLIVGHGGYGACERCETHGISVSGKKKKQVVYPRDKNCEKRTNVSFRDQRQSYHHTGQSPLLNIEPPIDMITFFPLDYMHLGCLGIMKKLYLDLWYFSHTNVKLKPSYRRILDIRIDYIKQWTPYEFQRKPRKPVTQLKATELRSILVYIGPVLFKKIIDAKIYKHYCLLHAAFRILCNKHFIQLYITKARQYLDNFFDIMPLLYGNTSLSINVHNLIHIVDDVEFFNCTLDNISAFPFENMLGKMRKMIRTGNRPLSQVCRRLYEISNISNPSQSLNQISILKQKNNCNNIPVILKIRYKEFILCTKKPNNIVLLKNDLIVQITDIVYDSLQNDNLNIEGFVWQKKKCMYMYPLTSNNLQEWKLEANVSSTRISCNVNDIKSKIVIIPLVCTADDKQGEEFYASALLHAEEY